MNGIVKDFSALWDWLLTASASIVGKLAAAVIIFIVGKKLIKWIIKLINNICDRGKVDDGVQSFISSFVRIALYVILFIVIAGNLGVETTSFITLIGSVGVTVGLALQGSLSNLAGGILILVLKPFKIGDYIVACGNEGVVKSIEIFTTKITTGDNRVIIIPNGSLANSNIENVTHEGRRRVDIDVPVSYSANINEVRKVLIDIYNMSQYAEKATEPDIIVNSFDDSSIGIRFRVWTATDNYWALRGELMENIKNVFDEKGIEIPYNQLDVFIKNSNN